MMAFALCKQRTHISKQLPFANLEKRIFAGAEELLIEAYINIFSYLSLDRNISDFHSYHGNLDTPNTYP